MLPLTMDVCYVVLSKKHMTISSFIVDTQERIWTYFLHENGIYRAGLGLLGEVNWMTQHCGGSSFKHSVLKLSLAAVVYGIRCERNCGVFRKQRINPRDLIFKIKTDLRACLISWKQVKKSDENWLLCLTWQILPTVFA